MAMDGKQILILAKDGAEYVAVAEQTSLSWENSTNLIEASSKDSGHTKWIPGKRDGSMSLEAAYVPDNAAYLLLKTAQREGTPVILRRSETGTAVEEVEAYISTISSDAPDNDKATISIDFQLNDDWSVVA